LGEIRDFEEIDSSSTFDDVVHNSSYSSQDTLTSNDVLDETLRTPSIYGKNYGSNLHTTMKSLSLRDLLITDTQPQHLMMEHYSPNITPSDLTSPVNIPPHDITPDLEAPLSIPCSQYSRSAPCVHTPQMLQSRSEILQEENQFDVRRAQSELHSGSQAFHSEWNSQFGNIFDFHLTELGESIVI